MCAGKAATPICHLLPQSQPQPGQLSYRNLSAAYQITTFALTLFLLCISLVARPRRMFFFSTRLISTAT